MTLGLQLDNFEDMEALLEALELAREVLVYILE